MAQNDASGELTRMDRATMDEAVDRLTDLPGVRENTVQGVWATFRCSENFSAAVQAATKEPNVVLYKADRKEGFVSIALEKYADEL